MGDGTVSLRGDVGLARFSVQAIVYGTVGVPLFAKRVREGEFYFKVGCLMPNNGERVPSSDFEIRKKE